ncbi:hypothetical protein AS156_27780 [Bradyrhizobium macuxiense]|uniref:Uncharacterized protein n=1 Tax=Bradyrhizobium macuxiense TaxID=1755647 RepID=A0A109K4S3_9BRAD|nr:hypothetical protein [Bradyrhizobium macuxiense]KWV60836.1 hypothetical protein AS156_27780 [Bradyrhizobium macuxiense]
MLRDISQNIGVVQTLAPAVQTATVNGTAVDTNGFESAAIVITTGAIVGAANFTAKLQDSSDGTNFTDVAASLLVGTLPAALAASTTYKQGYLGGNRYIRTVLTLNSGTSIAAGAVAVLGDAKIRPVA